MEGTPQLPGIIPLMLKDMFLHINENKEKKFEVTMTYIEIYQGKNNKYLFLFLFYSFILLCIHFSKKINRGNKRFVAWKPFKCGED